MRRAGLLIAGVFLATGAGLAMTAPASAAGRSGGDHRGDCDQGHSHYYDDFHYRHFHHHGGIRIGIDIGIGIGLGI